MGSREETKSYRNARECVGARPGTGAVDSGDNSFIRLSISRLSIPHLSRCLAADNVRGLKRLQTLSILLFQPQRNIIFCGRRLTQKCGRWRNVMEGKFHFSWPPFDREERSSGPLDNKIIPQLNLENC